MNLRRISGLCFSLAFSALLGTVSAGCADPGADTDAESAEADLTMGNKPWDDQAETEWATWIERIGEARASGRCRNVNACLNNREINPLKAQGDADLDVFADCADLPIEMRGYFALKTGRPFQFASEIDSTSGDDPRYARGNHPTAFKDARSYSTMQKMMSAISGSVHSGHYRMAGAVEDSDTYPVDVTSATVKPGTIFYDPNGHVLLVYKVDPSGAVHLMDGHPDNSLTFGIFSERFAVGGASQGGGFRRFRPLEFDGQTVRRVGNSRLATASAGFSAGAQYGRAAGYYPWVRERLSNGAPIQPVLEFGQLVDQLCIDLKERQTAVSRASSVANGPLGPVPANIYGASGEWEELSTPSRDARFKASFRGLRRFIESTGTMVDQNSAGIEWNGSRSDLIAAYAAKWVPERTSCSIAYKNSAGRNVTLTLADVEKRLFDMSFDPYHCPELRWGAYPSHTEEAASCVMDAAHKQRYEDERRQRNAIDREYGSPTPFSFGPEQPENVSLSEILR
jgi:hypothetical protein